MSHNAPLYDQMRDARLLTGPVDGEVHNNYGQEAEISEGFRKSVERSARTARFR
jgi:hypothetical protein